MNAPKVEMRQLKVHADGRGAVFEPLEPALLPGWRNVLAVVTEPGAVRASTASKVRRSPPATAMARRAQTPVSFTAAAASRLSARSNNSPLFSIAALASEASTARA